MNIDLVLHMDPVKVNDPETELYRAKVVKAIHQIDPKWGFHDFRIVSGPTHVNLVFDLVIPFEEKYSQEEIEDMLLKHIQSDKRFISYSQLIIHTHKAEGFKLLPLLFLGLLGFEIYSL